jgi:hypothetical protein
MDVAVVCPHRLAGNRQAESKSRSVASPAIAECLEHVGLVLRKPSAFVFHVDE